MQLHSTYESNAVSAAWVSSAREAMVNLAQMRRELSVAKANYEYDLDRLASDDPERTVANYTYAEYQRDFAGVVWQVDHVINEALAISELLNAEAQYVLDLIVSIRTSL